MSIQLNRPQVPVSQCIGVSFGHPMANAWGASFLRHLSAGLCAEPLGDAQRMLLRICCSAQAEFNAHRHAHSDVPACTVLGVSALMLSAYRELGVELGSSGRAYALVERSLLLAYQAFIRNICLPLLQGGHSNGTDVAEMNFRAWGHAWGAIPGSGQTAYQRFFERHGEPRLAQIMQTADQAWIRALADYSRIQRQQGAVETSGFCEFHFVPATLRQAHHRPDSIFELELRLPMAWAEIAYAGCTAMAGGAHSQAA